MTMNRLACLTAALILIIAHHSANSQAASGVFSTYLGGSADDGFCGTQITTDSLGYIYAVGYTLSDDIPTESGSYQPARNGGYDIFVAKFDPHLTTLLATTYLGGSGDEQYPAIAINRLGQVIITGYTYSGDFPTSDGVLQPFFGGGNSDAFVTILDADLSTQISSTYIGGSAGEGPYNRLGLQVAMSNEIYIAGTTFSGDFPTSPGAYRESPIGDADIFVSRLSADLSTLVASTYIGGSEGEAFPNLTFDNFGDVVVGTSTGATDYPTTLGAYNRVHSGSYYNGAISKLDPGLSTLIASTFVGDVSTCGIAADGDGSFFVTGHSDDVNYPTSVTAYDRTHNGVNEAIITKLDNDLENLLASTFLSGAGNGQGVSGSVDIDADGNVYATVTTNWPDMPTTPDAHDSTHNGGGNDAYLVRLDSDLSTLHYASFIGGSGDDAPSSLELDPVGNPVMAGMTKSLDFWTSDNCFEPDYNGGTSDCFVARFVFNQFTRITEGDIVSDADGAQGVCWADYDSDGFPDLCVTYYGYGTGYENRLFYNGGDGTFTRITTQILTQEGGSWGCTWGDYNNDGDPDAFMANFGLIADGECNYMYTNEGGGAFSEVTTGPIVTDRGPSNHGAWVDFENDGDLDLFVSTHCTQGHVPLGAFVYRNEGTHFDRISDVAIGIQRAGCEAQVWGDADGDRDLDLVLVQDDVTAGYYLNDGDGTFTHVSDPNFGGLTGFAWADFDNDGDLDLCGGGWGSQQVFLYNNNGSGEFSRQMLDPGDIGWMSRRPHWADFDNDGDLDLFMARGHGNTLYLNTGGGIFEEVTGGVVVDEGVTSWGAAWADYDRDGDLDLYAASMSGGYNALYRNNGNANNWLSIKCVGVISNRSAIGAKVRVKSHIGGLDVWQLRQISSQSGFNGQDEMRAHFGLGDASIVDSIRVEWPSGMVNVLTDVEVNRFLTVVERESCCIGLTGNVDYDPDDIVDIGDLTALIDYLFISYEEPFCMAEANTDGEGTVDIGDLTALIDFLFISYMPPAACDS